MRTKDELLSLVEFASITKVGDTFKLRHRSIEEDTVYHINEAELALAHPKIIEMLSLLLRSSISKYGIDGGQVITNLRRLDNATTILTKKKVELFVSKLDSVEIAKKIVQIKGELYRVERFDIHDGKKPDMFYATVLNPIGSSFSIELEVLNKQFPGFRNRLESLKLLDMPTSDWPMYLFPCDGYGVDKEVMLPIDFTATA